MIGAQIPTVSDLEPRLAHIESLLDQILAEFDEGVPVSPDAMRRVIIAMTTGCVRR